MEPSNYVPRWAPTSSPYSREPIMTNKRNDDAETESFVSEEREYPILFQCSSPSFGLNTTTTSVPPPIPFLGPIHAPSLRVDSSITGTGTGAANDNNSAIMITATRVPPPIPFLGSINAPSLRVDASMNRVSEMELHHCSTTELLMKNAERINYMTPAVYEENGHGGGGVYLTWKDLWVTVSDKKKGGRRSILQGITGYVKPGEALGIMGPSGCGKSTLLDALAGRLDSNTRQMGEILVNGRKQALAFGTSAYVTQDDTLMTTLTVKEAVYYSAQLQLPNSMSRSEKRERAESTIRDMGLQDAMNTRIGGWSVKGLSGGQKRRVSICIELLTRPNLLFLDEPTSGLDSAASYHVMNRIIKIAKQDRRTVIASIHQPSSEVFELFHNLCLLSSGRTIYFGAISGANQYFASNGLPCPPMRNPSDHFLRTINKDFDDDDDADIEQGLDDNYRRSAAAEAIEILIKSYKSSEVSQQVQQQVLQICQQNGGFLEEKKGSQASFLTQCTVLTKRSFVNMYRDLGYYWLRFAIYIALCLCVGTIYYDIGSDFGSIQARGSMLMFVAAFLTFMAIGGFPSFVEDMKIFTRERLNGHYGVASFVVGNTLSSIPYLLLISLAPGAIAYYLVGLQEGIDHFLYFALMLFACMMLVESLMMIVASIVPDFLMGIITGAGIQGVMMLNGGFFRLPDDLPKPFWKYPMYYISFHKHANQGFYKNEFQGLTFPNREVGGPATIGGDYILRNLWQVEMGYSKWVDVGIVFGMVILYRLMFLAIIKTVEKVKPVMGAFLSRRIANKRSSSSVEDPSSSPDF